MHYVFQVFHINSLFFSLTPGHLVLCPSFFPPILDIGDTFKKSHEVTLSVCHVNLEESFFFRMVQTVWYHCIQQRCWYWYQDQRLQRRNDYSSGKQWTSFNSTVWKSKNDLWLLFCPKIYLFFNYYTAWRTKLEQYLACVAPKQLNKL